MTASAFSLRTGASLHLRDTRPQDPAMPPSRTIITSIVWGPPIGGFVAYLVLVAYAFFVPAYPTQFQWLGWLQTGLFVIPIGYLMGFFPALIAGVVNAGFADSPLTLTGRLILSVPVGILSTLLVWGWLIGGMPSYNLPTYTAMLIAAGAVSTPLTVWLAARPRRTPSPQVTA